MSQSQRRQRFEEIYHRHEWGGDSRSGPGSDPKSTRRYVRFLDEWLVKHPQVRTVVEVGCGDWATSSQVDFGGRDYLGVDIVEALIESLRERYGSERNRFERLDFVEQDLPPGDLLIAKDVLQHLSNESVTSFLGRNLPRFKYAVFVNDVKKVVYRRRYLYVLPTLLQTTNADIVDGGSRPLDLRATPFNLTPEETTRYGTIISSYPDRTIYTKEIVVCGPPGRRDA
jgi:hypothetical protein